MAMEGLQDSLPTSSNKICPTCLNLDYDRFKEPEKDNKQSECPPPRDRLVSFRKIRAGKRRFCPICTVLEEGITAFYGHLARFDDEGEDEGTVDESEDGENNSESDIEADGENTHNFPRDLQICYSHIGDNISDFSKGSESPQSSDLQCRDDITHSPQNTSMWKSSQKPHVWLQLRPGRSFCILACGDDEFSGDDSSVYDLSIASSATCEIGPLEFFSDENDRRPDFHRAFGRGAVPLNRLSPDSAASILTKWITLCNRHEQCSATPSGPPRRLIDIFSGQQRLIESGSHPDDCSRYATLSHCWGKTIKPLQTTTSSYEARRRGIAWEELPTLFQDVIILLRKLGLRYLWIDSICIIQDNPDDWLEQSAEMAGIYSKSYLNLAAAAARDSSESLFTQRHQAFPIADRGGGGWATSVIQPMDISKASVFIRHPNESGHDCVLGEGSVRREKECPLLDRAWVYQEKLLAPRTAFFSRSELMWQCRESMCCECKDLDNYQQILRQVNTISTRQGEGFETSPFESMGSGKRRFERIQRSSGSTNLTQQVQDFWFGAINQYSSMALTKESDRVHAIAGVAQKIHEVTNDTYLAGLWFKHLPGALLWKRLNRQLEYSENPTRVSGEIPSWSWMSLRNGSRLVAKYKLFSELEADPRLDINKKETRCIPKGYQFGPVQSGQIKLQAASLGATVSAITSPAEAHLVMFVQVHGHEESEGHAFFADCPFDPTERLQEGDCLQLLLLGKAQVLASESNQPVMVCLAVKPAEGRYGAYRRVGLVILPSDGSMSKEALTSEFVLI